MRTEATGYGTVFFVEEILRSTKQTFNGKKVVVSGSGNVAIYAIEKIHQLGGTVIGCSDSTGYIVDDNGVDLELLKEVKEVQRARIADYAAARAGAHFVAGRSVWELACDIALPCATQN